MLLKNINISLKFENTVLISIIPSLFSRKFEDWGYSDQVWEDQLEKLKNYIGEEGAHDYEKDFYITAAFTDPSKGFREPGKKIEPHSEVWLVAQ